MPPKTQRRITLSAGEECTISGNSLVQLSLSSGVLDVAGVLLEPNRRYPFYLYPQCRSIVVSTLEGGSGMVVSEGGAPIEVVRTQTGAAPLVQLVRRTLLRLDASRVLVIGQRGGGKTLACHTICNLLHRHSSETEVGALRKVMLVDLNCESNCLFSPGTMAMLEVPNPKEPGPENTTGAASAALGPLSPLWPGLTNAPTLLPMAWYTGMAERPSARDANAFLFFSEQVCDTVQHYVEEELKPPSYCVVMDAPSPKDADLKEGVLYKKLIEVVKPTHVVIVGRQDDESDNWTSYLQEDVQRVLPECDFLFYTPLTSKRALSSRSLLLREYFIGTASGLLGCSKVVVAMQNVQFVQLTSARPAGGAAAVTAEKVTLSSELNHVVCALSHAELLEEVPLAPTAGLAMVSFVDGAHDEVVLIIPADQDPLLRRFIVVPSEGDVESLRLSDADVATIEEYVVP